jgi:2-polyprenyl-3-methyl-5-hydroxy-6-metoxy-1,4-benzoquinol methylase
MFTFEGILLIFTRSKDIGKLKDIICDLCGSSEFEIFISRDEWSWLPNKYKTNLVQCLQCNLIYQNPQLESNELAHFYGPEYEPYVRPIEEEIWLIKKFRLANVRKKVNLVKSFVQNKGYILDVGCSTGVFLTQMKSIGWVCYGIEPNYYAAEIAKRTLGINIFQGYLSEFKGMERCFDAITFWDVVEHTFSPSNELRLAHNLLKTNGILILNIPNWNAFDRGLLGKYWQGYDPPRHLYVFSENNIKQYLSKTGFKLLNSFSLISSYYSFVMGLARKLEIEYPKLGRIVKFLLYIPGTRLVFEPWLKIYHHQKRSSVITYVAQK